MKRQRNGSSTANSAVWRDFNGKPVETLSDNPEEKTEDQRRFAAACAAIVGSERKAEGIGTRQEKTVHAVVKHYMEPNPALQEQKVGAFVADIRNEQGIIEVQTANFSVMRKKLAAFLRHDPVTIVYPVASCKWVLWIDPGTGQISRKRKSPKRGTPQTIFRELYALRPFLSDPGLRFSILMIDMEEYRLLDGWNEDKKRGSSRYDRIPLFLREQIDLAGAQSFAKLLPEGLPDRYTTADFSKLARISPADARKALLILTELGITQRVGKQKNAYVYRTRTEENPETDGSGKCVSRK